MKKLAQVLFIITVLMILTACSNQETYDIVVTDYITYDIVSNIVGDEKTIYMIQPYHIDYHSFEPTSQDLVILKNASVFIYASINYSPWLIDSENVSKILKNDAISIALDSMIDHDHETLSAKLLEDDHDHDHDHGDSPHFLSNPFIVSEIVEGLGIHLSEIYVDISDTLLENTHLYADAILEEAQSFHEYLEDKVEYTLYYLGHNALQGFSEAFHVNVISLDESISPNSDQTSQEVTNFINLLISNEVKYVFMEENKSMDTANFIQSRIGGLIFYEFHSFHTISKSDYEQGVRYLDLLIRNISYVKEMISYEEGLSN
ncbi:Probable zinc transport system zinc-binding lipoprotein AdcA precursor [Acholeplasma oculi]|uniref:Zinc ABC transporter, periplasmic-binding protein ZnuA n=1 Tax=Acholeplasma oculi TaxID=35623 RepID=A0A061AHJ6_9MOLU|nr:metal ABC transporter substrate-binding protein [Acholeplasma oculi]CDR30452.1 Zinc ABC transporter, periplasmic-binding protein ZnuA [Acholeplasma oculi]SKC51034.1 zinc transport system substrate-binding protein [Acholeplasma oculi]SUT89047.1 Probable zinc transport system zinc-binding lipoprotein AdcA precursor [Acholeplasma oculi]